MYFYNKRNKLLNIFKKKEKENKWEGGNNLECYKKFMKR